MSGDRGVQQMNARVNVTSESALFTSVARLPTPTIIDGGRTHHVACNMAGTSAPSTNTPEIDVFCCSVDGPYEARPLSYHAQLDMEPV